MSENLRPDRKIILKILYTQNAMLLGYNRWNCLPGRVAQSVTCLATDACLAADPGARVRSRSGPILSWRLIMK